MKQKWAKAQAFYVATLFTPQERITLTIYIYERGPRVAVDYVQLFKYKTKTLLRVNYFVWIPTT